MITYYAVAKGRVLGLHPTLSKGINKSIVILESLVILFPLICM